jgi:hypothetical protein
VPDNHHATLPSDGVLRALRAADRVGDADALVAAQGAAQRRLDSGAAAAGEEYAYSLAVDLHLLVRPAGAGQAPTLLHGPHAELRCQVVRREGAEGPIASLQVGGTAGLLGAMPARGARARGTRGRAQETRGSAAHPREPTPTPPLGCSAPAA